MKIVVTGASGFIGRALVIKLLDLGHSVSILSREKSAPGLPTESVEVLRGDVTNLDSLTSAFQSAHSVFHLAGLIGYSPALREQMEQVNVLGTQNVIDACLHNRVSRLVHFSSVAAVGASFDGKQLLNENSEFNLSHLNLGYFETKRRAETSVVSAVKSRGLDAVIVNPSNVYGASDATKGSRKAQVLVAKEKMPFYTSGGVSIIHIEDLVNAVYRAWEVGKTGERYILSGDNLTIRELFNEIALAASVKPPSIYLPNFAVNFLGKLGDQMQKAGYKALITSENARASTLFHWYDNAKAKKQLGLNPRPAKQALRESVLWMKENNLLK